MNEHISFGMPFRILRHVDQSFDFRKQLLDYVKFIQPLQTDRRSLRAQEKLLHLSPDAFAGQIRQINHLAEIDRLGIDLKLKTRGELRGAQHAQTVFRKGFRRYGSQRPGFEIDASLEWIDYFAGQRILQDRVDGEVSSGGGFFDSHSRIAFDEERAMTESGLTFASRQ